jgi:hypothetical protein
MFTRTTTTITMTLAAIATVAVNLQAPVFAAEPSTEPVITEAPGLPGFASSILGIRSLEDALADYLAGLAPEEDDFSGPAEVVVLPDDVLDAIVDSAVDLPGSVELPPLTVEDTEPPIDELVCGEPGAICDGPDEGAELPLDPADTCGEGGVACEFDPSVDDEGVLFDDEEVLPDESYPWDVPASDDSEAPFDDHGWISPDHDESSPIRSAGMRSQTDDEAVATTSTVVVDEVTIDDSVNTAAPETGKEVVEVASALAMSTDQGAPSGIDPVVAALIGLLASILIAGLGYGAFRMGRHGA